MTEEAIRDTVLRLLGDIAPDADLTSLRPDANLRTQLDLDSLDYLSFLIAVDKELGVDIPERDYAQLTTLSGCVAYLSQCLSTADGTRHTAKE